MILTTASENGLANNLGPASYTVAKHGVTLMTESLHASLVKEFPPPADGGPPLLTAAVLCPLRADLIMKGLQGWLVEFVQSREPPWPVQCTNFTSRGPGLHPSLKIGKACDEDEPHRECLEFWGQDEGEG